MYMEMSQGNSLHSYLKQTKCLFLFLQNWKIEGWNRCCRGGGERLILVGGGRVGERVWEGEYSLNTVYTCMQMEK
jgi:hypothetical protein